MQKKIVKQIIAGSLGLLCCLIMVVPVLCASVVELPNPLGDQTITADSLLMKVGGIIKVFIGVTGTIALVMFIYGGFLWVTSGGSAEKVKKGKDVFLWSIIGLVIIFNSYLLVDFVIKGISPAPAEQSVATGDCINFTPAPGADFPQNKNECEETAGGTWVLK